MARSRLLVMLDLQNVGVSASNVARFDEQLVNILDRWFPQDTDEVFRAYPDINQGEAASELNRLEWRIPKTRRGDWDDRIIQDSKSYCLEDPDNTILVLVTRDGDYAETITELEEAGVHVYIAAPDEPSQRLLNAAGGIDYWIRCPIN